MINALYIIAGVGILLSLYTEYVEYKLRKNNNYKAACDINNKMSCSRTFHSSYSKMLGISNGWWGLLYYLAVIGLVFFGKMDFVLYATIIGVLFSARLANILYFKLKNFCLVCNGFYLVNVLLLVFAYLKS